MIEPGRGVGDQAGRSKSGVSGERGRRMEGSGAAGPVPLSFALCSGHSPSALTGRFLAGQCVSLKWRQEIPPARQPMRQSAPREFAGWKLEPSIDRNGCVSVFHKAKEKEGESSFKKLIYQAHFKRADGVASDGVAMAFSHRWKSERKTKRLVTRILVPSSGRGGLG